MSRVLAAKCALSIRVDAMGDSPEPTIGLESRQMVCAPPSYLAGPFPFRWEYQTSGAHGISRSAYHLDGVSGLSETPQEPSTELAGVTIADVGFEGGPDRLMRLHLL